MMAPQGSSIQLPTQPRSQNKTLGEGVRGAMHPETMTLGKKTLRPSVSWGRQIMAGAKEEIAEVFTKEEMGVIEALITIIQATTTTTREEGAGVGVATIRKVKEADIKPERIGAATIKKAAIKDKKMATTMVVILIEADTAAWAEEGVQEGAAIKMAIN